MGTEIVSAFLMLGIFFCFFWSKEDLLIPLNRPIVFKFKLGSEAERKKKQEIRVE